jgi:hypothetical protein
MCKDAAFCNFLHPMTSCLAEHADTDDLSTRALDSFACNIAACIDDVQKFGKSSNAYWPPPSREACLAGTPVLQELLASICATFRVPHRSLRMGSLTTCKTF